MWEAVEAMLEVFTSAGFWTVIGSLLAIGTSIWAYYFGKRKKQRDIREAESRADIEDLKDSRDRSSKDNEAIRKQNKSRGEWNGISK